MSINTLCDKLIDLANKASYYKDICNNEITNEYLIQARELLDNYLKKVEEI